MSARHDREAIYRVLYQNADRSGVIIPTQLEMAKILGIPYQRLSTIYKEFILTGRMKKYRHTFQVFNPDLFNWDGAWEAERQAAIKADVLT